MSEMAHWPHCDFCDQPLEMIERDAWWEAAGGSTVAAYRVPGSDSLTILFLCRQHAAWRLAPWIAGVVLWIRGWWRGGN